MIDKRQADTAPDFNVSDSENRMVRLTDYRGKKNVLLVFNRGFT